VSNDTQTKEVHERKKKKRMCLLGQSAPPTPAKGLAVQLSSVFAESIKRGKDHQTQQREEKKGEQKKGCDWMVKRTLFPKHTNGQFEVWQTRMSKVEHRSKKTNSERRKDEPWSTQENTHTHIHTSRRSANRKRHCQRTTTEEESRRKWLRVRERLILQGSVRSAEQSDLV